MSFVFYDTETTGLRIGFDQIVHFAAIRTDNDLNELERFEIRSKLLPYVVPHPTALLTNGLHIGQLTDPSLPSHYAMVSAIRRKLLEWTPSIFVGFNSMRFDEEMLRHAFFQSLHPAYLTNSHQNCRLDALGLALATAALEPSALAVPFNSADRPVFRLEELALANCIDVGTSHDALADAQATLGLARQIKRDASEVWQRFVRFSKKSAVEAFVDDEDGFVLTEFYANEAHHSAVVCIGPDPDLKTRRLCLRLDAPLEVWATLSDEELTHQLAQKPSPVRRLKVNAAPTLTAMFEATDAMLHSLSVDELEDRARAIKKDAALRERVLRCFLAGRTPYAEGVVEEQRIYGSFPSSADEQRMSSFHEVAWPDALRLAAEMHHPGLRLFATRVVYCEARSVVPPEKCAELEIELTDRLMVETDYGFTLQQALSETVAMIGNAQDQRSILAEFREYLAQRLLKVSAFRADVLMVG